MEIFIVSFSMEDKGLQPRTAAHKASIGAALLNTLFTKPFTRHIIAHKSIGNEVIVGAGSVVMRNIKDGLHVHGNPAVKIDY